MNKIQFLEICQRMRYGMVEDLDVSTAASWVLGGLRAISEDPAALRYHEAAGAASVLISQLLLTRRLVASRGA